MATEEAKRIAAAIRANVEGSSRCTVEGFMRRQGRLWREARELHVEPEVRRLLADLWPVSARGLACSE